MNTHSHSLKGRRILLGVTGGIAAYKAAELVRLLAGAGAEVRVVMTRAAGEFITPLTFQALSGNPVRSELFDEAHEAAMGHIELARWADRVVIAPASANTIARIANGLADDLLSTLCLATRAPLLLAPAMNVQMWRARATRENVARLVERGVALIGPASGELACGEVGEGRLVEPQQIVERLIGDLCQGPLAGVRVTITAGPTREAIDPVRYISNRSSGRMGIALAEAARNAGAAVRLVVGPVAVALPSGVECVSVESAGQMLDAALFDPGEIFIAAAAVGDFRSARSAHEKIKRDGQTLTLELTANPDIVATIAALERRPFCVAFAAETEALESNARDKLKRKGVDMIAANWVGDRARGGGFESEMNALELFWAGGRLSLPMSDKRELAREVVGVIAERYSSATGNRNQEQDDAKD